MRNWRAVASATACVLSAAWAVSLAAPAQALTADAVPYVLGPATGLTPQSRMIAANGHLYVSQGRNASDTVVLDLAGNRIADVTGEPGSAGMLASPDQSRIYVALANTNVKWPSRRRSTASTEAAKSPAVGPCRYACDTRCTATSVSVSLANSTPSASSSWRRLA